MFRRNLLVPLVLFLALACVVGLAGCSSPTSSSQGTGFVGTWAVSMGGQASPGGPSWQFGNDGKLTEIPAQSGKGVQATQGEYSLSGDILSVTTHGPSGSAVATMPVQWVNNDQFKLGMGGAWLTFTRKK